MPYERKRPALDPCPVEAVVAIVGGKWKARILRALVDEPLAFGRLKRTLGTGITQQVLSTQLDTLRRDGMIERKPSAGPTGPSSIYALTEETRSLLPALDTLALWGARRLAGQGLPWPASQGPVAIPAGSGIGVADGSGPRALEENRGTERPDQLVSRQAVGPGGEALP